MDLRGTGPTMVSTTELLRRSPNYDNASAIAEVDATNLTPYEFHNTYVLAHQPCVIRGAAAHWPAITNWDVGSLRAAVGETTMGVQSIGVLYEPLVEYSPKRLSATSPMTMNEFLDEIEGPRPRVQMYAERLTSLEQLSSDLGTFTGIDVSTRRARFYQDRFFLSRRGYTDWHVHTGDETLTAQLVGHKEFLLHEPAAMKTLLPMAKIGVWQTEPGAWPVSFASLVPRRVVLHPGDVIYIPMHWWHAVEALGDSLNATYAHVFATPWRWMGDLRLQNVRFSVVAALGRSLIESIRSRRPRQLRHVARVLGTVVVGLPAALWHNRTKTGK